MRFLAVEKAGVSLQPKITETGNGSRATNSLPNFQSLKLITQFQSDFRK